MILKRFFKQGLIQPPKWLPDSIQFLTIMGSESYGVASNESDLDIYGWCIPPKHFIFPHLAQKIPGFSTQIENFENWQQHHIKDDSKEYDFAIYSIVNFFSLAMGCNPNIIDFLYVPRRCILYSTPIGEHVRENRKLFLHKGSWHNFKNYSYSMIQKINNKTNSSNPKRAKYIEDFGYDVKFAYNCVRLIGEIEQIMIEHDLDLERNREQLKSIRRGEWSIEQLQNYFVKKESELETVYLNSSLPIGPDEPRITRLLFECLEMYYGNINTMATNPSSERLLDELKNLVDKYTPYEKSDD